jgi:DNA-binding NtrC family response regulator
MIDYSIYIVDDEPSVREGIALALAGEYRVESFSQAEPALEAMSKEEPDLILLDIGLPAMSGIDALREIKSRFPEVLVIMITAYEDVDTVVSAMKLGAHDYVVKPLHMETLEVTIRNALDTIRLRKEVQLLQESYLTTQLPCFIGESDAIQDVMGFIQMVAKSPDTPILLLGGTGTGKELLASSIHFRSPNFKGPLITVNCAAIPKELIESELFGYEKGAFTGAGASGKKGLIEEAEGGTLFLDEVGDLSLEAQSKLLRFLDEGEFYRVGGTKKLRVQTRVVSATNKDVEALIKGGLFREDLYFRLGVIKVQIPSLNERRQDIIPLAKHFLLEFSRKFEKEFTGISRDAEMALTEHNWTGNIRELKNLIERAVLIGRGPELSARDIGIGDAGAGEKRRSEGREPIFPPIPPEGIDLTSVEKALERFYIEEALEIAGGNESKASRLLRINHHTFRYRRKKLLEK